MIDHRRMPMADIDSEKSNKISTGEDLKIVRNDEDFRIVRGITRRNFLLYTVGAVAGGIFLGTMNTGCGSGGSGGGGGGTAGYPIDSLVVTTVNRMLSFQYPVAGLSPTQLSLVSQYGNYGYGNYTFGQGLPIVQRLDLMPKGYSNPTPVRVKQLVNFFAMTDIHITDKEAPNQLIYNQQEDSVYGAPMTSLYSPVMLCTTQVLDAALQTVNALHGQTPFDFGISLGDAANSSQYNELRWYIDVIDGKLITPSSGAHAGAATIDYQKLYQAAGLNRSIPWYQVLGNHDHFWLGSVSVDADPTLNIQQSYISSNVWAVGDLIAPNVPTDFPCTHDTTASIKQHTYYMGVLDGSTPTGSIIDAGTVASISPPPTVPADPDRRPLLSAEWIQEFFTTTSTPVGHGFNLVAPSFGSGFACYSFLPKSNIPLKVIVLDDTQSETDGSHDIHGHAFLDATRWNWLQAELAAGQAANQLMVIAAHIPIAVAAIGSCMEWWESDNDPNATEQNAVSLTDLVAVLQNTTNLLMWIAGHRHLNTVKAFLPPAGGTPENGFWQVETSALRDFPQQFRTFEIYLNSDYTISIVTTNVDPAVAGGTPAATSRCYSIATQQIVQNNLTPNFPNVETTYGVQVETMDPSRAQNGSTDPTILWPSVTGVPYCASYNAELFKQLSPVMISALQVQFPPHV
jgi:metallophosphoesterase (TIGR03768 family)